MFPLPSSSAFFTPTLSRRFRSAGFTLIELLTTVAIIGTLAALLFPTMKASLLKAQSAKCQSILRQFGTAAIQYTTDNNGMALPAIVYTTQTTGNNWPALLRTYLGASDMYDKSRDAQYTCPAMAKTSANAWAWGYGINARPGYNGATTVYPDNRLAYQNSPTQWFAPFQSLQVSNQSRRALLVDGDNWQIDPSLAVQSSGAALSRHGTNRCNVVFFDGHVETVAPDRLYKTLFDPASS